MFEHRRRLKPLTAGTEPPSLPGAPTSALEEPPAGLQLFTFLSIRTVKTSRSLRGSLLKTRPWLNSWMGWLRLAVRFELDRPISFPLRGCSSAAIFRGAARIYDTLVLRRYPCLDGDSVVVVIFLASELNSKQTCSSGTNLKIENPLINIYICDYCIIMKIKLTD